MNNGNNKLKIEILKEEFSLSDNCNIIRILCTEELHPIFCKVCEIHNIRPFDIESTKYSIDEDWGFDELMLKILKELVNKYNHDLKFKDKFNEVINEAKD